MKQMRKSPKCRDIQTLINHSLDVGGEALRGVVINCEEEGLGRHRKRMLDALPLSSLAMWRTSARQVTTLDLVSLGCEALWAHAIDVRVV